MRLAMMREQMRRVGTYFSREIPRNGRGFAFGISFGIVK
jgi:hypothetical protein